MRGKRVQFDDETMVGARPIGARSHDGFSGIGERLMRNIDACVYVRPGDRTTLERLVAGQAGAGRSCLGGYQMNASEH
jgi:hypothetical protein